LGAWALEMSKFNREELVQTLFEESGDALFLFDPNSEELVDVNPMVLRLSGFTRQELLRMQVPDVFRSDAPGRLNHLRYAFRTTGVFHSQEGFLLRTKQDGSWIPLNLTITRLHVRPKTLGLITARDVREQRQTHEQLKKTEAELRRVLASASDCLWSVEIDREGRVESGYVSPVITRLTGRPPEFFTHWPESWLSIISVEDRPGTEAAVRRFKEQLASTSTFEYRVLAPHGTLRWLRNSVRAAWDPEGACRLNGVVTDITERKGWEEAVLASESKYRLLTENLEQCVLLKDGALRYVAANRRFCEELGLAEQELVGKTDLDFHRPEVAARLQADDRRVLIEGKRLEREEQNLWPGKPRTVRMVKTPVRDAQDQVVGVLGIIWDVTEQRALEAQLRQAQKMEAVGQLAGGVAHDFNNLLTVVLGNVGLLQRGLSQGDPNRALVEATETAAHRAADLTRKMLGFSRHTTLWLEPANLNACVQETIALLQRTIDPRIQLDILAAPDLWLVQADSSQISQILMNLCINARDAMPGGGALRLETENIVLDEEFARSHLDASAGELVRLRVQDTGAGIPPEILPRIFEPFFTTKEPGKGTGLGLAMVFGIVKQHGGWIDCNSKVGEGTRFDIYLPRYQPQSRAGVKSHPVVRTEPSTRPGQETILLVDDEAMIRNLGRTILEGHGYHVHAAGDGLEAIEIYRREKGNIDLVIMDLVMPRLSGQDAFRQLQQLDSNVRVLFASGYSAEQIVGSEMVGVLGFLDKPYRPEQLTQAVGTALHRDGMASKVPETRRV
jgi:two-component system cell cycle sensor histidine kinase/response regulator CckA